MLHDLFRNRSLSEDIYVVYHLVSDGETSRYDLAKYIVDFACEKNAGLRVKSENIYPIPTSAYPLPAKRPLNSRLNTQKLVNTFDVYLPDWQWHVQRMLSELL